MSASAVDDEQAFGAEATISPLCIVTMSLAIDLVSFVLRRTGGLDHQAILIGIPRMNPELAWMVDWTEA